MKHLLTLAEMGRADIEDLLDLGDEFVEVLGRDIPKVPTLRGQTVATMFFEPSTRTRLSFERAARALSADVLSFSPGTSSVTKGESLKDTALTLRAMGADLMVVRHSATGAAHRVAEWVDVPVVNGGDGAHQHPTQAILDALTIRRHFGSLEGLRIGIVGDIRHSRVARSCLLAFSTLGAGVTLVAPPTLLPLHTEGWPAEPAGDLDAVIGDLDVVYLLRIQAERGGASGFTSLPEYVRRFGLDDRRFARLHPRAVVMHPGPMNRGVEISPHVADSPRTLILDQVRNGVAARMAVLFRLLAAPGAGR
ncbi:MAG TPA: aspartate carbamoyltransferase catalytic subunit [Acidimicrobiia bacterium]|nr:aspartate carbamoyltransferase catalytic subunit [Acidimicrobiia bacterium]